MKALYTPRVDFLVNHQHKVIVRCSHVHSSFSPNFSAFIAASHLALPGAHSFSSSLRSLVVDSTFLLSLEDDNSIGISSCIGLLGVIAFLFPSSPVTYISAALTLSSLLLRSL